MISSDKEISQAVIFLENEENFYPLTLSKPKCLMNLVNRPILEYSLDMLASSKIQEVFIFCSDHLDKIKNFISAYKLKRINNKMNIQLFFSEDFKNLGAAMRDLDSRGLIKGNFILMNSDCIGNVRLDQLIEKHKQIIQNDPGCVMTCIFRKMSPHHRTRSKNSKNLTVFLNPSGKFLMFEKNSKKVIDIQTLLFERDSEITINHNLFDTKISICSEKVLLDFSDNFDFESRENFINGLLAESELLDHHIYAHILDSGYAAGVDTTIDYANISSDLLQRFIFPIVPDSEEGYSYRRNNVYLQNDVHLHGKYKEMKNSAIGRNTKIGSDATIINSSIGSDCIIGDKVTLKNSFIFNGVKIGSNCLIENCMIDSNVSIKENCTVKDCLLGEQVILNKNLNNAKLYYEQDAGESDMDLVGSNGRGINFKDQNEEDEGDQEDPMEDDYDSDSTKFSDSPEGTLCSEDDFSPFYNELSDSLSRAIEEKSLTENIILEINSSKHAYNVPVNEVNSLVMLALLELSLKNQKNFFPTLKSNLTYALPIIRNYIKNTESQNDCLYAIEEFYLNHNNEVSCLHFTKIIEFLYQENILEEEVILEWFNDPKKLPDHDTEGQDILRKSKEVNLFVKWLEEAEEESDEDEDEDD